MRDNGTLGIIIKQGKLYPMGMVEESAEWNEMIVNKEAEVSLINADLRTMYLDNVVVSPNFVVTGEFFYY